PLRRRRRGRRYGPAAVAVRPRRRARVLRRRAHRARAAHAARRPAPPAGDDRGLRPGARPAGRAPHRERRRARAPLRARLRVPRRERAGPLGLRPPPAPPPLLRRFGRPTLSRCPRTGAPPHRLRLGADGDDEVGVVADVDLSEADAPVPVRLAVDPAVYLEEPVGRADAERVVPVDQGPVAAVAPDRTVSEPDARPEARLLGVEVVVPVAQLGGEVAARVGAEDEPPPRGPAAPVRAVGGGGQGDVDLDLRVVADAELGLSVRREQAQAQRDDREGPAHDGGPSGRRGGGDAGRYAWPLHAPSWCQAKGLPDLPGAGRL